VRRPTFRQPAAMAASKITDSQTAIEHTRRAIDDGIISAEHGENYIRSLQGAIDQSDAIRAGAPGTIGAGETNKARRAYQQGFWSKHSAGNQQVKSVKHRAYHQKGGYPFDPRATPIEDQVSIPPKNLSRKQFADFVTRWNEYGSGRGKR
jgi:hypothetical protein